jgi:hypothetical protein
VALNHKCCWGYGNSNGFIGYPTLCKEDTTRFFVSVDVAGWPKSKDILCRCEKHSADFTKYGKWTEISFEDAVVIEIHES